MRKHLIYGVLGMLCLLPLCLQAEDGLMERRQIKVSVDLEKVVQVENHFGDIRLRKGGLGSEMEIGVVFQQLREDGIRLDMKKFDSGNHFAVGWLVKPSEEIPPTPVGDRSRADMVIRVPVGASLRVESSDGLIEAKGVEGQLDLHSNKGEIRFNEIRGTVQAESQLGGIRGVLLPGISDQKQEFKTLTGEISLWFSPDAQIDLLLRTSGRITTDFSLNIEHHDGEEPEKYAEALLAKGGEKILMSSRRGDLSIRRLPVVQAH